MRTTQAVSGPAGNIPLRTSKKLLEFCQSPTLPGVTNNCVQALSRPQNRDQFMRMDYIESSRSSWAGRYSWGDENESTPGLNQNGGKNSLDTSTLARITGLSVASVRRWRLLRKGPMYLKIGAAVRYRPDDLAAWINSRPVGGADTDAM